MHHNQRHEISFLECLMSNQGMEVPSLMKEWIKLASLPIEGNAKGASRHRKYTSPRIERGKID